MKLFVKKSQARRVQENKASIFNEYDLPFEKVAVGVSQINGRYPKDGFETDKQVEQVWYVESGKGRIFLKDHVYNLDSGDMISIPKGEKYWIEGEHLKLVVVSNPPWFSKQHIHVDK